MTRSESQARDFGVELAFFFDFSATFPGRSRRLCWMGATFSLQLLATPHLHRAQRAAGAGSGLRCGVRVTPRGESRSTGRRQQEEEKKKEEAEEVPPSPSRAGAGQCGASPPPSFRLPPRRRRQGLLRRRGPGHPGEAEPGPASGGGDRPREEAAGSRAGGCRGGLSPERGSSGTGGCGSRCPSGAESWRRPVFRASRCPGGP